MPITIPRTGNLPPADSLLTQEQKDRAWEAIIRAWAQKHPDRVKQILTETEANT